MSGIMARARDLIGACCDALRRVIGVPDYAAYLAHVTRMHPDRVPLSRDAFVRDVLARRYERPGSRCC
jgi:uncharacterized short protein YbdD (DUF466 family)